MLSVQELTVVRRYYENLVRLAGNRVERELSPTVFTDRIDALCMSACEEARGPSGRCAEVVTT